MTAFRLLQITLVIGLAGALGPIELAEAGRIKCWTNNDGVRECGNVVPPEYAQKGHTEKSQGGLTTKVTEKAKSKDELEKERAERAKKAAEEKEKSRRAAIEAEKDRVLLSTYTSEDDLILAKNGRIAAIDSRINHSKQILTNLEASLSGLQKKAAKRERSGKKIDQNLLDNINHTEKQIADSHRFVDEREQEKLKINEEFAADMARWKRLRGQ